MLKKEKNYDFKKGLLEVHKKNRRVFSKKPLINEFVIPDGVSIVLPRNYDNVIYTAAKDFSDYLFVSMNIPSMVSERQIGEKSFILSLNQDIGEAAGYMGYRITITDTNVLLEGYDNVGIAQGLYFLEDLMNIRQAPYLEKKIIAKKSFFDIRIAQSPFGMFEFTDECLALMAHRGYNGISLWIQGLNKSNRGDYIDMPLLCERAEKYGIDVYIQLYAEHSVHPDEPGAQEFYDNLYGEIFKHCPKIKGVDFVGETTNFHSKDPDPHVGLAPLMANFIDNIPTGKVSPGFWPCNDYPALLSMIKNSIRKYNENAEIIFCTYNWSWAPAQKRLELIKALPDDIILNVAWGMCDHYDLEEASGCIVDYSLRQTKGGKYFFSEAEVAKERGLKVISITNTAGRTWDFGVIPYEPMPYRWIELFENIITAHKDVNLTGMIECIHYGFHPSFVGDLEKWAFFTHEEKLEDILRSLLIRDFGEQNIDRIDEAMKCWSEAISHYICSNEEQYGAFRLGPSYPLWVVDPRTATLPTPGEGKVPTKNNAMFGNGIYFPAYTPDYGFNRINSLSGVRIFEEINEIEIMTNLFLKGINILENIKNPNDDLLRLINIGKFMYRSCITGLNVKKLYILTQELSLAGKKKKALDIIEKIEMLLLEERDNVIQTIPLVQVDSRLGWEPSMEYQCDEECLNWKLRQLEHELNFTLPRFRQSNDLINHF